MGYAENENKGDEQGDNNHGEPGNLSGRIAVSSTRLRKLSIGYPDSYYTPPAAVEAAVSLPVEGLYDPLHKTSRAAPPHAHGMAVGTGDFHGMDGQGRWMDNVFI